MREASRKPLGQPAHRNVQAVLNDPADEVRSIPARALVRFENGESVLVDKRIKWEKVSKS